MSDENSVFVERHGNFRAIRLKNKFLTSVILPQIGGKMIQLKNNLTHTQFLLPPQNEDGHYKMPYYGALFDDFDTSGFDECFPTIEKTVYRYKTNHEWEEIDLPDHGELWCREWNYVIKYRELKLWINGIALPYRFEKTVRLQENTLIIDYCLVNLGTTQISYLWSAHPLLKISPGVQILFKDDLKEVFLNWASDSFFERFGECLPWPNLDQKNPTFDFSCVPPPSVNTAIKCFTPALQEGIAGLYYPDNDETILFKFNTQEVPYVGLWLCYGGWPIDSSHKHYTIGIEPASGRPDSLQKAIERNEHSEIAAGDIKRWQLEIQLLQGRPDLKSNNFQKF